MRRQRSTILLILLLLILFVSWLIVTPHGFAGKVQAVGYAFCHQFPQRSPQLGGHCYAFCHRCTGLFSGILLSLLWMLPKRQAGRVFSKAYFLFAAFAILFFAVDVLNASILRSFFKLNPLYADLPAVRGLTGFLMGVLCGVTVYPIFNRVFFTEPALERSPIQNGWQIAGLAVSGGCVFLVFYWNIAPLLSIWEGLIAVTAVLFMSALYALVVILLTNHQNHYESLRAGLHPLLLGVLVAFVQIGGFSVVRYALTQTWSAPF